MILVIYFHVPSYCLGNAYMGFNDVFEKFRMPLFFFISGFVFYKANRLWNFSNAKEILKRKFVIQIIPTFFFLLLYLYLFKQIDFKYFGSDKGGYWYTYVLFEFYTLYIIIEYLFNRNNTGKGEAMVMFVVISLSFLCIFYSKYYTKYGDYLGYWKYILGLFSFVKIRLFIFFWFGTIIRKHFDYFIRLSNNPLFITCIILLYIGINIFPISSHMIIFEFLVFVIIGTTGIIILFTFFRTHASVFQKDTWIGKSLQFIGRRTLDIYLIHYFILPYNLQHIGAWLLQHDNKSFDMIIIFILSLWIICLSLAIGSIIRLSPILSHYLLGVSLNNTSQQLPK